MSTATLEIPVSQTPVPKAKDEWKWLVDAVDQLEPGQAVSISGTNWDVYQRVMDRRDGHRPGMRISYDRGELHIMPTFYLHEKLKKFMSLLFEMYCIERIIDFVAAGGMTVSQEDRDRGFEPDECYYLQSHRRVLGKEKLDFTVDPPPDLTIEIEVTSPVSRRLPIYAAFQVPEIWRYNGETITILHLMPDGRYEPMADSLAVPGFPFDELPAFLTRYEILSNTQFIREFREWIRANPKP